MVLFKHPGLWELCVHTLGKASCASWISGNSFILSIIRCFFQLFVRFPTWRRLRWNVLCLVSSVFPWRFHRSVLEQSSKEQVCPAVTAGNCATALLASVPSGRLYKRDGSVWKEGSRHWQEAPRAALPTPREVTGSGDAFQSCISMLCEFRVPSSSSLLHALTAVWRRKEDVSCKYWGTKPVLSVHLSTVWRRSELCGMFAGGQKESRDQGAESTLPLQSARDVPCPENEWYLGRELQKDTFLWVKLSDAHLQNWILSVSVHCISWMMQGRSLLTGHFTWGTMHFVSLTWKASALIGNST